MASNEPTRPDEFPQHEFVGELLGLRYLKAEDGDWRLVAGGPDPDIVGVPARVIDEQDLRQQEHFKPA